VINLYGQLFSIAELIASGYASLVSSGVPPPPGSINMIPFFQPQPCQFYFFDYFNNIFFTVC
jgi:hypothetical protein